MAPNTEHPRSATEAQNVAKCKSRNSVFCAKLESSLLYDSRVLRKVQHDPTIQQAKRILTRPVSQKTQGHVFLGWHEKITVPPTSLPVTCHNISEKPTDPQVLAIPEPHRNPSLWV